MFPAAMALVILMGLCEMVLSTECILFASVKVALLRKEMY